MRRLVASLAMLMLCLALPKTSIGRRLKRQDIAAPPCTTDSGAAGTCSPLTECPTLSSDVQLFAKNVCPIDKSGALGVCCPNVEAPDAEEAPAIANFVATGEALPLQQNDLSDSSVNATQKIQQREKLEQLLLAQGLVVQPDTPERVHNQITFADKEAQNLGKQGLIASETSQVLSKRFKLTPGAAYSRLPKVSIAKSSIASACPKEPICSATKYRSYDGSCNNLKNKDWGKASRAFQRMSAPTYADGLSKPRVASDGGELPSCRLVSTTIIHNRHREFPHIDSLFMSFGQFLDHDLTLTPSTRGANGSGILCCPPLIRPEFRHPECMEIAIPANDPFYSQFGQICMEFVRTLPAPPPTCTLGPREQLNQLTNFVDSSQVYGSSEAQAKSLRDTFGGRLRVANGAVGGEFPPNRNSGGCTGDVSAGLFCIEAGDVRATEQPVIAALHTAFLREHNRIAAELAKLNPRWSDEILYQETRRILQAKMQYIVYNEYLPIVLGNRMMKRFNLELKKNGYFNKYNPKLDPTTINEFATAAFRFGHSLVQSHLQLIEKTGAIQCLQLRNHFAKPFNGNLLDDYFRGATTQASQMVDNNLAPDLTNHLFQRNNLFGLDLGSLNCQRGRDHSIGTYPQLRKICGLSPVTSFKDLAKHMDKTVAQKFSQIYKSVNDIDLWVGGVSETPMSGAVVGPTFGCIIAEQFRRLRLGDRLWFERGNTESSFSKAQLAEIRKSSLARILCDNTDIDRIQPFVLLKALPWNAKVSCNSRAISKTSVKPWKNEPV